MHRVYCSELKNSPSNIILKDKAETHHLRNVLRAKTEDVVSLFDGKGGEAEGMIISISPKEIVVKRRQAVVKTEKPSPQIILACAVPKRSKFELIIEKATELGVDEIFPLITERTKITGKADALDKKLKRFQKIALSATKQSKRVFIPNIHPMQPFNTALEALTENSTVFIPSLQPKRENILKAFKGSGTPKKISFLIGPEGDFTDEEYNLAGKKGCIPVSLGKTILRVETAAICALSCANLFYRNDY